MQQVPPRLGVSLALTGPPSTGKTELSRRVARALNLPFYTCQGSAIASLDDLLDRMEGSVSASGGRVARSAQAGSERVLRFPPMVVFIDEAHEIKRAVQESMLTLLEPRDRRAVSRRGTVLVDDVTFILATTEWGDLIPTLQSRVRELKLDPYDQGQVAEMVRAKHPDWDGEVLDRLAIAGRLVPRVALERADELEMAVMLEPEIPVQQHLDDLFDEWRIDADGISETDRRFLQILVGSGGRAGLDNLCTQLNISRNELVRNIEPFLIRQGLVIRSGTGREITTPGRRYVRSATVS